MSMTTALNNALSGLNAVGRSAQVVSSNIANALSPGYGRRDLQQSSGVSGGVQVNGIGRTVNAAVLSDRRLADARVAEGGATTGFLDRFQTLLGAPGESGALTGRLTSLEGRLLEAASRPDSNTRLAAVAEGARALASQINAVAAGVQAERAAADGAIARDVETLNATLKQVRDLNAGIARMANRPNDSSALRDQRQLLIDRISEIVPVRQIPRDRDAVALITTGGQVILDSQPAVFEFTHANTITPGMTQANGLLSGLMLEGQPVVVGGEAGRMDGGRLAGNFAVRDELAPKAQSDLDAIARDLIERFAAPGVDPTLAVGDPGLFTDNGSVLSLTAGAGLAQRLTLNALADPNENGLASRLRDGLGAAASGPVGNATVLQALTDTLNNPRMTPSGVSATAAELVSDVMSRNAGALFRAEQMQVFQQSRAEALHTEELTEGVDTDQEMQKLLLIEQSYGANARVIQVIDDMMRRLLEI